MLVTGTRGPFEAPTATAVASDAELAEHEDAGDRMYDYDIHTGKTTLAFDGAAWLTERPDLGPHRARPNYGRDDG